ncbi:MAG: 4-hydroxythreonine-4-phosphate dehydrogenase PdxA [Blastocatellia bacterium]|nr:4-hydroxythreonine-4-phosphate dehydrogenase PdxA [Blastocatellia bacterium]
MKKVAITMGDPAGVGPEIVIKALGDPEIAELAHWIVIGDQEVMNLTDEAGWRRVRERRNVDMLDLALMAEEGTKRFRIGRLNAACGRAALAYVRAATEMCLSGKADAMATAPINKEAVSLNGIQFSGHTEYIAELCGAPESWMLLANDRMRVIHVSTHVPLRRACGLDSARIQRTIELGNYALIRMGLADPRIAVCGLNPHAGENGLLGEEDAEFIAPAVAAARARGIECAGPLPADTLFLKAARGHYDLIVAMYHDQGHIPIKLLSFEDTVNVSLGIPIIRTSVDHGTAFDIAGKGIADPANMKAALRLAAKMAHG